MNFNEWMMQKQDKLFKETEDLKKRLYDFPEGDLMFQKRGEVPRWYVRNHGSMVYLPREQEEIAARFAQKRMLEARLKDCQEQLSAIGAYLKQYQVRGKNGRHLFLSREEQLYQKPGIRELLGLQEKSPKESLTHWQYEEFDHLTGYEEGKKIQLTDGRKVRSKSEAMIGNELLRRGIAFRYEEALEIAGRKYYPDFTIRPDEFSETIIWEHLGLMDEGKYRFDASMKIHDYMLNGYYPGINLILTSETRANPLDFMLVDQIIRTYIDH